jgi:hypothetical protein
MLDLIYCAGANPKLDEIASDEGFLLGVRSDRASYYPVEFVDVNYKKPDFDKHLARVAKEQPKYATVPDLSEKEFSMADIVRAVDQAEQLKSHCQIVLIVPKLPGQIEMLPKHIAIGYSIPTSYGGAKYSLKELISRNVHLLGGSPAEQLRYYRYTTLMGYGRVISVDGSAAKKGARWGDFWNGKRWERNSYSGGDHYYDSWRKSCQGIKRMWEKEFVNRSQLSSLAGEARPAAKNLAGIV